jgi:hypothetical protein
MKHILVSLVLLAFWSVAGVAQENLRYYEIRVQDRVVGYIECRPVHATVNEEQQAEERTTVTFLLSHSEEQPAPQTIIEKHVYRPGSARLLSYSLEYRQGNSWEQQLYVFGKNSVTLSVLHNSNKTKEATVTLPPEAHIASDYFSLLPLLAGVKNHPLGVSVVDLKRITPEQSSAPLEKMTIVPSGDRLYSTLGQTMLCKTFAVKWDNGTTLQFWLNNSDQSLLRIEEPQSKTVVALSTSEVKKNLSEHKATLLPAERQLPFALGKPYLYRFYYDGQVWGSLEFSIERKEKPDPHYLLKAQGDMQGLRNRFAFSSETVYGLDYKIIAYRMQEGEQIEIACDFVAGGVKERYRRQQSTLERMLPLTGDFVFLDNNGIHHLAMFMVRFPTTLSKPQVLPIFHPRRMMTSAATFTLRQKLDDRFVVYVETPYYNMEMTVTNDGRLVRYTQGKLEVTLSEKKD